ncbi:MAG: hypothetical protein KAT00_00230 [Planctomycetes bacterium]|nr:hypothetical protein [Planctomycetota bacterium]
MATKKPTPEELRKYATEYVRTGKQVRAWRATFPARSERQLETFHYRPNVQKYIAEAEADLANRLDGEIQGMTDKLVMDKLENLQGLTRIARAGTGDLGTFKNVFIGEDEFELPMYQTVWVLKDADDISALDASNIKSVTPTKYGYKYEMYDGLTARKQLADLQGWNAPKVSELTGPNGEPLVTPTAVRRTIIDPVE